MCPLKLLAISSHGVMCPLPTNEKPEPEQTQMWSLSYFLLTHPIRMNHSVLSNRFIVLSRARGQNATRSSCGMRQCLKLGSILLQWFVSRFLESWFLIMWLFINIDVSVEKMKRKKLRRAAKVVRVRSLWKPNCHWPASSNDQWFNVLLLHI